MVKWGEGRGELWSYSLQIDLLCATLLVKQSADKLSFNKERNTMVQSVHKVCRSPNSSHLFRGYVHRARATKRRWNAFFVQGGATAVLRTIQNHIHVHPVPRRGVT